MKKAFDSVNREAIRDKCMEYNIQLGWLSPLVWGLSIQLENCTHQWVLVDRGTTQGSALGPLFFNIAMEDFPKKIRNTADTGRRKK